MRIVPVLRPGLTKTGVTRCLPRRPFEYDHKDDDGRHVMIVTDRSPGEPYHLAGEFTHHGAGTTPKTTCRDNHRHREELLSDAN